MEVLLRLINQSVNNSLRGLLRWTDALQHPAIGWEKSLIPLQAAHPHSIEPENAGEEDEGKWTGFLWAAPKKRTSKMKRLRRKFGHSDWGNNKMLSPRTDLRTCETCGHHYQAKHLCGNCYERNKSETEAIRKQAESQFGHGPEDKSIVVLYEKETLAQRTSADSYQNQIVVEVPKPRPTWFSSNLLQRTTLKINTDAKAVTPTQAVPKISSK